MNCLLEQPIAVSHHGNRMLYGVILTARDKASNIIMKERRKKSMATEQERLLKMEHDAWLANSRAETNAANIDYLAMMTDVDIPTEEEGEINESEI